MKCSQAKGSVKDFSTWNPWHGSGPLLMSEEMDQSFLFDDFFSTKKISTNCFFDQKSFDPKIIFRPKIIFDKNVLIFLSTKIYSFKKNLVTYSDAKFSQDFKNHTQNSVRAFKKKLEQKVTVYVSRRRYRNCFPPKY